MKLKGLYKSKDGKHKYMAVFEDPDKTTHFGAFGYSDFLHHKSEARRQLYLGRHRAREDWTDPTKAGTLSAYLLWGPTTSLRQNLANYRKHFQI